jgi:hypothetical protein
VRVLAPHALLAVTFFACGGDLTSTTVATDAGPTADAARGDASSPGDAASDASLPPGDAPIGPLECPATVEEYCAQPGSRCYLTWSAATAACASAGTSEPVFTLSIAPCSGYLLATLSYVDSGGITYFYEEVSQALVGIIRHRGNIPPLPDGSDIDCLVGPPALADLNGCAMTGCH